MLNNTAHQIGDFFYPHSTATTGRFKNLLGAPFAWRSANLFIVFTPSPAGNANPGVRRIQKTARGLVGPTLANVFVKAKEGHEAQFRNDLINLLRQRSGDMPVEAGLASDRSYLIVIDKSLRFFRGQGGPFIVIDVTQTRISDVRWIEHSIRRLSSRRFLGKRFSGMAQALFTQDLELLGFSTFVSKAPGRPESALDILSSIIEQSPRAVVQFCGFRREVLDRFDSIVDETLNSREGAAPFSTVLSFRQSLSRRFADPSDSEVPGRKELGEEPRNVSGRTVFVCHTPLDRANAQALAQSLSAAGLSVSLDGGELLWGESIISSIALGLATSTVVVVCVGRCFDSGNYAKHELEVVLLDEKRFPSDRVSLAVMRGDSGEFSGKGMHIPPARQQSCYYCPNGDYSRLVSELTRRYRAVGQE